MLSFNKNQSNDPARKSLRYLDIEFFHEYKISINTDRNSCFYLLCSNGNNIYKERRLGHESHLVSRQIFLFKFRLCLGNLVFISFVYFGKYMVIMTAV